MDDALVMGVLHRLADIDEQLAIALPWANCSGHSTP